MNTLRVIRDEANGIVVGLGNPDYVNNYHFAGAGTATVTWPTDAKLAHIIGTAAFWAKSGAGAAVPAADITNGTASRNSPSFMERRGEATFTLAVSGACEIGVEFYS